MPSHKKYHHKKRLARPARRAQKSVLPVVAGAKESQQNATIIETIEFQDLSANLVEYHTFTLAEFPRASAVATNFEFYKADKVVWTYEPLYNTFQDSAGGISKPYLYVAMNRRQRGMTYPTLQNVQAMGAQPITLSSKKDVIYRPNWTSPGLTFHAANTQPSNTFTQGAKVQYAWLQTQPGTPSPISGQPGPANPAPYGDYMSAANALYNGHIVYADQAVTPGDNPRVARVTCTVHWKFKGAVFDIYRSEATAPLLAPLAGVSATPQV